MSKQAEDRVYRLSEMIDSMDQSAQNAEKVIDEQKLLVKILSESDHADKFEQFIKENGEAMEHSSERLDLLKHRADLLREVVQLCEKKQIKSVVNMILEGLAVFE